MTARHCATNEYTCHESMAEERIGERDSCLTAVRPRPSSYMYLILRMILVLRIIFTKDFRLESWTAARLPRLDWKRAHTWQVAIRQCRKDGGYSRATDVISKVSRNTNESTFARKRRKTFSSSRRRRAFVRVRAQRQCAFGTRTERAFDAAAF